MPGTTNYPAALDAQWPITAATPEDQPGVFHDEVHLDDRAALVAIQTFVGTSDGAIPGSVAAVVIDHESRIDEAETDIAALEAEKANVVHAHAAGDITSGTFADARIAESNVTQHEGALAIGWGQLTGTPPALLVTEVHVVADEAAQLALTAQEGDIAIRTDESKSYAHNGGTAGTMADWSLLQTPTDAVLSVNGQTGAVSLGAGDVGLGDVDNTSDADKPVSTATQTALDAKQATSATLTAAIADTPAGYVWSGPAVGADAAPIMRLLVATDIPTLTLSKISDAGTAAAATIGTSGATVGLLNANKTDSGDNTFTGANEFQGNVKQSGTSSTRLWCSSSDNGEASVSQTSGGLLLTAASMNAALQKYTPGYWFGSSDSAFTTRNPKIGAGMVGAANETHVGDTDGGMNLEFYATPINPGADPAPTLVGTWSVASGLAAAGALSAATTIKPGSYTVATLPAGTQGMTASVTNANATTFASAVAGGGANEVPVYYGNGAWRIG